MQKLTDSYSSPFFHLGSEIFYQAKELSTGLRILQAFTYMRIRFHLSADADPHHSDGNLVYI